MEEFEAYKLYLCLKQHFEGKYDYFKYNGKIKANKDSFLKRKDRIFFQKLAKHKNLRNFLVANFIENSKIWVRDLAYSEQAEQTYQKWLKKQQSITYIFKQDIEKLDNKFDILFVVKNNEHPELFKSYLASDITIETLCILLEISKAKPYWDKKLKYDLVWEEYSKRIEKYSPFIEYDKDKIKNIIFSYFVPSEIYAPG